MKLFNNLSMVIGGIGGILIYWLGGMDMFLEALLFAMVCDYITGIIKAIMNKNLSSKIGFEGLLKKIMIIFIVALSVMVHNFFKGILPIREIVICFYVSNEGISIMENCSNFIPMPQKLKDILLQIRNKGDEKDVKSMSDIS